VTGSLPRFGWGIIGTGDMAATMACVLAAHPQAELVAVASRSQARAIAFAASHAIANAYAALEPFLANPDMQICYIATPPDQHHAHCLQALAAGKHVLCEKPLATTACDAGAIAAAADAASRFCMEALWTHFLPAVTETERLLAAGAIGTPSHIAASFGLPTEPAALPACGAILDRGCYPISLALRLFGTPDRAEAMVTRSVAGSAAAADIMLHFPAGRTAALGCSLVDYRANTMVISGSAGRLTLHEPITHPTLLTLASARAGPVGRSGAKTRVARLLPALALLARHRRTRILRFRGNGYVHQVDEVHACIADGRTQSGVVPLALSIATLLAVDGFEAPTRGS
jgi:predicted dehydrogenase